MPSKVLPPCALAVGGRTRAQTRLRAAAADPLWWMCPNAAVHQQRRSGAAGTAPCPRPTALRRRRHPNRRREPQAPSQESALTRRRSGRRPTRCACVLLAPAHPVAEILLSQPAAPRPAAAAVAGPPRPLIRAPAPAPVARARW
eukprot:scaffold84230_cov75-Phaeocystis_antarctica.AAC.2